MMVVDRLSYCRGWSGVSWAYSRVSLLESRSRRLRDSVGVARAQMRFRAVPSSGALQTYGEATSSQTILQSGLHTRSTTRPGLSLPTFAPSATAYLPTTSTLRLCPTLPVRRQRSSASAALLVNAASASVPRARARRICPALSLGTEASTKSPRSRYRSHQPSNLPYSRFFSLAGQPGCVGDVAALSRSRSGRRVVSPRVCAGHVRPCVPFTSAHGRLTKT